MHSKISYDAKCSSIKYLIAWISVISQCWPLDNKQNFIGYVWTEVYWKKLLETWHMKYTFKCEKTMSCQNDMTSFTFTIFSFKGKTIVEKTAVFFFNFLWNVVYKGLSINCFLHKQKKLTLPFESVSVLL